MSINPCPRYHLAVRPCSNSTPRICTTRPPGSSPSRHLELPNLELSSPSRSCGLHVPDTSETNHDQNQTMTRFASIPSIIIFCYLATQGTVIRDQENSMLSESIHVSPSCAHFDAEADVLCTSASRTVTIESCPSSSRPLIRDLP